ncbi:hypothetical protein D9Q98_000212 [Chlorella vulgaris]|uniref:SBP-type domain-containing protein n=1 Tax=Chlorella vulgaris TaxID=3077 RepID=A0A9D4TXQ5_CHLVU|nr:hypothetical protein D9Q98_000212 [Chlorella vulgaris]
MPPAAAAGSSEIGGDGKTRRGQKGTTRGPRPRLYGRTQCQADGCKSDLAGLPRYHLRNHICLQHKTAESFLKQDAEVRFCQRCGVAHPLAEYDGLKKSCRRMLALHNSRRRKSDNTHPTTAAASAADAGVAASEQQVPPQRRQEQPLQLLPALAGMQLSPGSSRAQPARAPAAGGRSLHSPAASVGSAPLSDGSWQQRGGSNSSSGSGSLSDALPPQPDRPPPPPPRVAADVRLQQASPPSTSQPAGFHAGAALSRALPSAACAAAVPPPLVPVRPLPPPALLSLDPWQQQVSGEPWWAALLLEWDAEQMPLDPGSSSSADTSSAAWGFTPQYQQQPQQSQQHQEELALWAESQMIPLTQVPSMLL